MLVKIRDYFVEDWPAIEVILRTAPSMEPELVEHEKRLINLYIQQYTSGRVLVAQNSETNQIVGYIILRFNKNASFVESLLVDHKQFRKGVGSQLIEFAKKLGRLDTPNLQVLRMAVLESNQGGLQFLLENGFQICGYVKSDVSWYTNQIHLVFPLIDTSF